MAGFSAEEYKRELATASDIKQLGQKLFQKPGTAQRYLFISYAHDDYKRVYQDLADLRERGIPFWFDEGLLAGENWDEVVRRRMADFNCAGVVFYLSDSLFLSESIQTEIRIAYGWDNHPDSPRDPLPCFAVNLTKDNPNRILARVTPCKKFQGIKDKSAALREWFNTFSKAFPDKATYLSFSHVRHMEQLIERADIMLNSQRQRQDWGRKSSDVSDSVSLYDYVCQIPRTTNNSSGVFARLRYDSSAVAFCGREQEMSMLREFVDTDTMLSWWAITGAAGSGKTRLAYEFFKEVDQRDGWCSRFINWPVHQNALVGASFKANIADGNLLLVFDYVYAYQNEIAKWIEQLHQTYTNRGRIRILLIEREYKKIDATGRANIAPWEEMFCAAPNYPMLMKQLKHREQNINLNYIELTEEDKVRLIQSYCENTGRQMDPMDIQYIVDTALYSGKKNTPLSLLLLAEHFLGARSSRISLSPMISALETLVERDIQILNSTLGIDSTNGKLILNRIMHISTILGKVETTDPLLIDYVSEKASKEKYWAVIERLKDSPVCERGLDDCFFITGIQPDLVGEYYAFTRFETMSMGSLKRLLDKLHSHYPAELRRFLIRYIEDGKRYQFDLDNLEFYSAYLPQEAMTFVVYNDDNERVECEVLFTFENGETKKNYIVYTDNSQDNDGNTKVYASIYDPNADRRELLPIKTEREWKVIETILELIQEDAKKESVLDVDKSTKEIGAKLMQLLPSHWSFLDKLKRFLKID